jgi:hypothetical protein
LGGAAGHWIEHIDLAVTEIPDPQLASPRSPNVAGASAKPRGELSAPPSAKRCKLLPERSNVSTMPFPGPANIVGPVLVLHRKGHKKLAADCADIEWRVTVLHRIFIGERAGKVRAGGFCPDNAKCPKGKSSGQVGARMEFSQGGTFRASGRQKG